MGICIGRHGLSYLEARRCTMYQLEVLQIGFRVNEQIKRKNMALQAFYNMNVKATKGEGKNIRPKYEKFGDFYDEEKEFKEALRPTTVVAKPKRSTSKLNAILNPKRGG